jgi:Ca-activated chloride channel homolog
MVKLLSRMILLVCAGLGGCAGALLSGSGGAEPPPALAPGDWHEPAPEAGPLLIHTDPGELPRLQLARDATQQLSLEHTHVSAKLNGFVAEVEVTQTYTNPFSEPIEAVYVFPLPENSAVRHLRMVIDRRVIEAQIEERAKARRVYQAAKQAGHTAALLEQERPNVFTQSVANIEPGKKIDVVVRYLQDLTYDAGKYEFVFPMVVGPRYMPGAPRAGAPSGGGTKPDTTRVPDASRVSPPYVGEGERSGRTISLEVVADARGVVGDFEVPTHEVVTRRPADGTLHLTLAEKASIANRDFVLRYRVAGAAPAAALSLGADGYFSLVVQPPELDVESLVGQREVLFVVDVSGSMSGEPLMLCKAAVREALRRLRPVDTFNILTFAGSTRQAFERARPANLDNVREGLSIVDDMSAGGGTELSDAVDAALRPASEAGRNRYIFFLTDGYVGNEDEIITASRSYVGAWKGGKARVFGFGVGSSPNRYLLDGLSKAGDGVAVYASNREDPLRGVDRFFHYIDRAVLEHLRVDWGGLHTEEAFPSPIPDLFASHPVIVHGRYRGKPAGKVTVRADVNGRPLDIPVEVRTAPAELGSGVLGTLWAREKLTNLDEALLLGQPDAQAAITRLGLDFHLVTRFTSLIAVDSSKVVGDGAPRTVQEPLDAPEGVDVRQAGGATAAQEIQEQPVQDGAELQDICKVDPGACPTLDMNKEAAAPAPEQAYAVAPRRGCGCRAVGASGGGGEATLLALLGISAWVGVRRRGRSQARAALR